MVPARNDQARHDPARHDPERLAELVRSESVGVDRYLLGLAGPPGCGKSTIAARLGRSLDATVVPMDGFHLPNATLDREGLRSVKGAPETFDAAGFVAAVDALRRADDEVVLPTFDRTLDEPVADSLRVPTAQRIVIVEGNYLLLDQYPWANLRDMFDTVGYIDIDRTVRIDRLIARHVEFGRTRSAAVDFVHRSDEVNTTLIEKSRDRADLFVTES